MATAVEYVDLSLARDLKMQIKERPKIELQNGEFQVPAGMNHEPHHIKYKVHYML